METREQIESILKNKYSDIERVGNRFNIYFDLKASQKRERITELNNIYQYLKGALQRVVVLNSSSQSGSTIGSVDIVQQSNPYLSEIKIFSKPKKISPEFRPGMRNEMLFEQTVKEGLSNRKFSNMHMTLIVNPRSSRGGSGLTIPKVRGIIKTNATDPNNKVDFTITAEGESKNISLKKTLFFSWTGASNLKAEVKELLDDALSKGVIIKPGIDYKFNPKSSFSGVARRARPEEIRNKIFGETIHAVIIGNINQNDLIWDDKSKTLTLTVDRCYVKNDVKNMLDDVFLYVRKEGSGVFGNYRGFRAEFVPSSRVATSTMISTV